MQLTLFVTLFLFATPAVWAHHAEAWIVGMESHTSSIVSGLMHPFFSPDHLLFLIGLILLRFFYMSSYPVFMIFIPASAIGLSISAFIYLPNVIGMVGLVTLAIGILVLLLQEMAKIVPEANKKWFSHLHKWVYLSAKSFSQHKTFFLLKYFHKKKSIIYMSCLVFLFITGIFFGQFFGDKIVGQQPSEYGIYILGLAIAQTMILYGGQYIFKVLLHFETVKRIHFVFTTHMLFVIAVSMNIWIF